MRKSLILIAAAATLLVAACGTKTAKKAEAAEDPAKAEAREQVAEAAVLPEDFLDFTASLPGGGTAKLSDFVGHGKYILVDFWASWCGPCRREIPNIKNVYETYHGDLFDIVSVAVWDKPEDSLEAIEEEGLVWNQLIDAGRVPTDLYGIEGIPHLILFGPDGTIVARDIRGPEIGAAVAKALGK